MCANWLLDLNSCLVNCFVLVLVFPCCFGCSVGNPSLALIVPTSFYLGLTDCFLWGFFVKSSLLSFLWSVWSCLVSYYMIELFVC